MPMLKTRLGLSSVFVAALLALLPAAALAQSDCPAPTRAEAEAIARAYLDAFNEGDRQALDGLLAADYKHAGAIMDQDRALHLDRLLAVRTGFPDGVYTIDWIMIDGDKAVVRHRFHGTHSGEFTGFAPTGRKIAVGAFHVHRIACGKIAETWNAGDGVGLFRQIGVIPGPHTTPSDEEAKPAVVEADPSCTPTPPDHNVAAVRRWYDEVLNQGKVEVLDEILDERVVHHAALFTDSVGRQETGASLMAIRSAFPDIQYSVEDAITDGDRVLVRWRGKGTHTGEFRGLAATGKSVDWMGMNAFRFSCGKIVEGWSEANGLAMLRQLGAFPPQ